LFNNSDIAQVKVTMLVSLPPPIMLYKVQFLLD
jgi:hypothetical protein